MATVDNVEALIADSQGALEELRTTQEAMLTNELLNDEMKQVQSKVIDEQRARLQERVNQLVQQREEMIAGKGKPRRSERIAARERASASTSASDRVLPAADAELDVVIEPTAILVEEVVAPKLMRAAFMDPVSKKMYGAMLREGIDYQPGEKIPKNFTLLPGDLSEPEWATWPRLEGGELEYALKHGKLLTVETAAPVPKAAAAARTPAAARAPAVEMPSAPPKPASQLKETWRPFCGFDVVHYALELQQAGKTSELRDLHTRVAERAHSQFELADVAPVLDSATAADYVDAIVYVMCRVRLSPRWNAEVHYYGNEEAGAFAAHLRDAIDFSSRTAGDKSRVELARKRGFQIDFGVHSDGTVFLTKKIPDVPKPLVKFDAKALDVHQYAEDEYCPRCVAITKDGTRCKNYAQCRLVKKGDPKAAAYAHLCATHFKQYANGVEQVVKAKDQNRCYMYVGSLQSLACEFLRKYGRGESDEAKRYRKSLFKVLKASTGISAGNTCPRVPVDADIRPYCGSELLVYALELEQCTKTKGSDEPSPLALLYDLYKKVARHAREHYKVKADQELDHKKRRSKDDLLQAIIKVSCMVRSSKAYKSSVHLYGDPEVFATLLRDALQDEAGAKYERPIVACHGDGSFVITEKLANGKKKHHVWVGVRGDLICTVLNRYACGEQADGSTSSCESAAAFKRARNDVFVARLYNLLTDLKGSTSASRKFGRGMADAVGASVSESQA